MVPGLCKVCRISGAEQPPAANILHGQLGLNALVTAILLHIVYRLPFRQVKGVFADLLEMPVSAAAIARQVQRIADWLDGDYEQLLVGIRAPRSSAVTRQAGGLMASTWCFGR